MGDNPAARTQTGTFAAGSVSSGNEQRCCVRFGKGFLARTMKA